MRKALFTFAIVLLAVAAQAQIKIHQNGQVSLSTMSNSLRQGVQFLPTCTYFNSTDINAWSHVSLAYPKHSDAKSWIVVNPSTSRHTFFVTGAGVVYYTQFVQTSRNSDSRASGDGIDGQDALNTICQINGYSYKPEEVSIPNLSDNEFVSPEAIEGLESNYKRSNLGFDGQETEIAFPDAVRYDPEGNRCIDYNAVTVMLLEAVKEQQKQIEDLKGILINNGLLDK